MRFLICDNILGERIKDNELGNMFCESSGKELGVPQLEVPELRMPGSEVSRIEVPNGGHMGLTNMSIEKDTCRNRRTVPPLHIHDTTPITIEEIRTSLPQVVHCSDITDFFAVESFFANSLSGLWDMIAQDPSNDDLVLRCLSIEQFGLLDAKEQATLVHLVEQVVQAVINMQGKIQGFNFEVGRRYYSIMNSLRLWLLLNVKSYGVLENSRVMLSTLRDVKKLFGELNFANFDDMLGDVKEALDNYNDYCDEIWDIIEKGNKRDRDIKNNTGSLLMNQGYQRFTQSHLEVTKRLLKESDFMRDECTVFKNILDEVVYGFSDFFNHMKEVDFEGDNNKEAYICYEIILFDDHLKEKYI